MYCMLCLFSMVPSGNVYIEYPLGPRTDPWGTPYSSVMSSEVAVSIATHCLRPQRYDLSQSSAPDVIPCPWLSRWSMILWSKVSKAADRSNITNATDDPLSSASRMSVCTFKNSRIVLPVSRLVVVVQVVSSQVIVKSLAHYPLKYLRYEGQVGPGSSS